MDQAQLSTLAEDRLDRFNSLLAEQVAQLQQELFDVEHPWRLMVGVLPPAKLAAARVQASALREQAGLARDLVEARHDLVTLQDPRSIKAWNGLGVCALNSWLLSDRLDGTAREEARHAFERSLEVESAQPQVERLLRTYAP